MDDAEKLERILGREDWETLTREQVMRREHELEQVRTFLSKLRREMRLRKAATVGQALRLNGHDEE